MILDELRSRRLGDDRDLQLAVGNLDLNNLERIDDFDPDKQVRENRHSKSPPGITNTVAVHFNVNGRNFKTSRCLRPRVGAGATLRQQVAAFGAETSSPRVAPRPNCQTLRRHVDLHSPAKRSE